MVNGRGSLGAGRTARPETAADFLGRQMGEIFEGAGQGRECRAAAIGAHMLGEPAHRILLMSGRERQAAAPAIARWQPRPGLGIQSADRAARVTLDQPTQGGAGPEGCSQSAWAGG